jgi:hypothetical protein
METTSFTITPFVSNEQRNKSIARQLAYSAKSRICNQLEWKFHNKYGDYWFFKIENTCHDFPIAHDLRIEKLNEFICYIRFSYGIDWRTKTKGKMDDCYYLEQQML